MTACTYCGHDEGVHDCGSSDFPTGCMYAGSAGADYRDAENCDGFCLRPQFEAPVGFAASGDTQEAPSGD